MANAADPRALNLAEAQDALYTVFAHGGHPGLVDDALRVSAELDALDDARGLAPDHPDLCLNAQHPLMPRIFAVLSEFQESECFDPQREEDRDLAQVCGLARALLRPPRSPASGAAPATVSTEDAARAGESK